MDDNDEPKWFGHPDSNVDIAIIPIDSNSTLRNGFLLPYERFGDFDDLVVGQELFFFGYPFGITELTNEQIFFPILRKGIVSYKTLSPILLAPDIILPSNIFLVDGFSFGGNSGSPVLSKVTAKRKKAQLIGIVRGHVPSKSKEYQIEHSPESISIGGEYIYLNIKPSSLKIEENSGLAIVHPVNQISETIEYYKNNIE